MGACSQQHRVDHELVLSIRDDNQLEEVASTIGPGHQVPGWIVAELEPGANVLVRVAEPRLATDLTSEVPSDTIYDVIVGGGAGA